MSDTSINAPTIVVSDAIVLEDRTVALNISVTPADPGDEITSIIITGVPVGATLSAGTDNGDGSWTLVLADLTALTLTPPADYSGTLNLSIVATATDGLNSATTTVPTDMLVDVTPVADAPTLATGALAGVYTPGAAGLPGSTSYELNLDATLTDLDGSEVLSVIIAGIPSDASLSSGTDNGDGTWSLAPADLTGLSLTMSGYVTSNAPSLTVTATSTEQANGDSQSVSTVLPLSGLDPVVPNISMSAIGVSQTVASSTMGSGSMFKVNVDSTDTQNMSNSAKLADGSMVFVWADQTTNNIEMRLFDADGNPKSSDLSIDPTTMDTDEWPDVTALANGGYVVSWKENDTTTWTYSAKAQVFSSDGVAMGAEFTLASSPSGVADKPSIEGTANGGFVAVWTDYADGVQIRHFASDGTALDAGSSLSDGFAIGTVNSTTMTEYADVAVLSDGSQMVSWVDTNVLYTRSVDANGTPLTGAVTVASAYSLKDATITAAPNGGHILAWHASELDPTSPSGMSETLEVHSYDATGTVIASVSKPIYAPAPWHDQDVVASYADGSFVVTWTEYDTTTNSTLIMAEKFDANGVSLSGEVQVDMFNSNTSDFMPSIVAMDDGGFVVDWTKNEASGHTDIYGARYDASGNLYIDPVTPAVMSSGAMFQVNADSTNSQVMSNSAKLADGSVVFVWSDNVSWDSTVIEMRLFDADGNPKSTDLAINPAAYMSDEWPDVTALANGGYVVSWKESDDMMWSYSTKAQVFTSDGVAVGAEFTLASMSSGMEDKPSIEGTADGGFVAVWTDNANGIQMRYFSADGTPVNDAPSTTMTEYADVAVLSDGSEVVSWVDANVMYTRTYDSTGAPITGAVSVATAYSLKDATVSAGVDGGYILAWHASELDPTSPSGMSETLEVHSYDATGTVIASVIKPIYAPAPWHDQDVVASYADGSFAVTWTEYDTATNSTLIMAEKFDANGISLSGEVQVDMFSSNMQDFMPSIVAMGDGGFVVDWTKNEASGHTDIYAARYDADGTLYTDPVETTFSLNLDASLDASDGTEVLSMIVYGVPDGGILSAGTDNGDGTWGLTQADFGDLTLTVVDAASYTTLSVEVTSLRSGTGETTSSIAAVSLGTDGRDFFEGSVGNEFFAGGSGDDFFVFSTGGGNDTVTDFTVGDALDLRNVIGVTSVADVLAAASQVGSDTVIDFGGGDSLTLNNVDVTSLSADDMMI